MLEDNPRLFLSYAREDESFAIRLVQDLRDAGLATWMDQLDAIPGEPWDATVQEALESCSGLILIISPDSMASRTVMDEVAFVRDRSKPVFPVRLRDADVPFWISRIQYVDFTVPYEEAFPRLLTELQRRASPPENGSDAAAAGGGSHEDRELVRRAVSDERFPRVEVFVTRVRRCLDPLLVSLHRPTYRFLANREGYDHAQRAGGPPEPLVPLSNRTAQRHQFWNKCRRINGVLGPWERQEPFSYQFTDSVRTTIDAPVRVFGSTPRVSVHPTGWATVLRFHVRGPLDLEQLEDVIPRLISADEETLLVGSRGATFSVHRLLSQIDRRIQKRLFEEHTSVRPHNVLRLHTTVAFASEPSPKRPVRVVRIRYTPDEDRSLFSLLHHRHLSAEEARAERAKSTSVYHRRWRGYATLQYRHGILLDFPALDERQAFCRGFDTLQMIVIASLLQSAILAGKATLDAIHSHPEGDRVDCAEEKLKQFAHLLRTGQIVLRRLPEEYTTPISRAYQNNHQGIQSALTVAFDQ